MKILDGPVIVADPLLSSVMFIPNSKSPVEIWSAVRIPATTVSKNTSVPKVTIPPITPIYLYPTR